VKGAAALIGFGGSKVNWLVAQAAPPELHFADKLQDFCHWAASEKESSDRTKDRGRKGTAERCVKGLLVV
jgi:hypothetical protein